MALVDPGRKAPSCSLPDQQGKTHSLADSAGRAEKVVAAVQALP